MRISYVSSVDYKEIKSRFVILLGPYALVAFLKIDVNKIAYRNAVNIQIKGNFTGWVL